MTALVINADKAVETLTAYGLGAPCDPRWIVAAHRCHFGEQCEPTIRTVMAACRLCAKRTDENNEALAKSYGL